MTECSGKAANCLKGCVTSVSEIDDRLSVVAVDGRCAEGGHAEPKKKAVGRQGWWFAQVDEIALPCLHKSWLRGLNYHDPFKRHEGKGPEKKIKGAVDAIIEGRQVVLTTDKEERDHDGEIIAFERTGYIAVFEVDDVTYSNNDGLRLRLTKLLYDLE